ncbi:MAG: phosphotransferase [Pseudomonadota bacterium]
MSQPDLTELDVLAQGALRLWDLPADAVAVRINVSENVTYRVDGTGDRAVLRLNRPGYHSRRAIECELVWIEALRASGTVSTPPVRQGWNGQAIQWLGDRHMVLFDFAEGSAPNEDGDLSDGFRELGAMAARTHLHSMAWQKPEPFERLVWDVETIFGRRATWGDWRAAPNVTQEVRAILERVETRVRDRLAAFGKDEDRYGLIHADMRLANLLVGPYGTTLIDFDDCGLGWHLYDFAAAISFIEDSPQIPALKTAWLDGYRSVRPLPDDHAVELDTFIMLRRLALLAWIGSHIDAPEPQALAQDFARVSAELGRAFLDQQG